MSTLVLNMGLKSIRSIVFDDHGRKLAQANEPLVSVIKGDEITQNPNEWWEKAVQVINQTIEDRFIRDSVRFMTVTASSACLVPVSKEGTPLYDAIMVSDKRAIKESQQIAQMREFEEVRQSTGLESDPYLMLPKILWMKHNEPDVYANTHKFLSPNDFLMAQLTGNYVTDELNAQKYHYDTKTDCFPQTLLDKLGIRESTLPEVSSPGTRLGVLRSPIKALFGFKQDVEVYLSTYDAICAFIGSGPKKNGDACDVSGTVTSLRTFANHKVSDSRILNTPINSLNANIVGGSNNLGGGLIEWVKQCYYMNEKYPYEIMEKDAKESIIGANGLIFLPYLMGERAPLWDPDARGVFFGIERTHTRKNMTRAVFESTGFCTRSLVEAIEENDIQIDRIRVSGGLTRIPFISQLKADILGKEVVVVDEFETTALGAALIVGLGAGRYQSIYEATSSSVKDRMVIIPNEENHRIYNEIYAMFQKTYDALKDMFYERAQILKRIYIEKQEKMENL